MYRIKPPDLFTINGEGWLTAVKTLAEDTYTMAVVARDQVPIDVALIVVHVQQDSSTLSSDIRDRTALIAIGVVCGAIVLVLIVLITLLIVKNHRLVVHFLHNCVDSLPVYNYNSSVSAVFLANVICHRQSVCRLSVVCNVRAPYSGD